MATFSHFFPLVRFFLREKQRSKLSLSPKSATNFYPGRRLRPLVTFHSVAVAEVGDKNLSHSPTSAAGYFFRLSRQRGLVFFFYRLAHYKYLPTYLSPKFYFFFLASVKKNTKPFLLKFKGPTFNKFYIFCQDGFVSPERETAGLIR